MKTPTRARILLAMLAAGFCVAGSADPNGNMVNPIYDLQAASVDTITLTLQWSAPLAQNFKQGIEAPADSYELRYSPVFPGYEYTFDDLLPADADLPVPGLQGEVQSAAVRGLDQNHTYWFMIRSWYHQAWDLSNLFSVKTLSDPVAPATITSLAATPLSESSMKLNWTAPGDDGLTGTATRYEIRRSASGPIGTVAAFAAADEVPGAPYPSAAGSAQTALVGNLAPETTYWFAIRAIDEVGNPGALSPTGASATTMAAPPDTGGGDGGGGTSCGGSATGAALWVALLAAAGLVRR